MLLKGPSGSVVLPLLLPCLLLGLQAGCASPLRAESDLQRLQGTWEGVARVEKSADKITITITGDSFNFHRDTNFWFDTTITLPAGTDPRQLRATITRAAPSQESSTGQVIPAIFKVEGGTLTLAAFQDNGAEPPKSFDDDKAMHFELRKVQPHPEKTGVPTPE